MKEWNFEAGKKLNIEFSPQPPPLTKTFCFLTTDIVIIHEYHIISIPFVSIFSYFVIKENMNEMFPYRIK